MGKIKDLTGLKFGKLTVLEQTSERRNRQVVWKCLCDCGNITYVVGAALRDGHTQSCGCKKFDTRNYNDLTGQRFGNLVVISKSDYKTSDHHLYWNCQCGCGNYRIVRGTDLINGKITVCYNCQKHKTLPQDLYNQRFGSLIALYPLSKRDIAGHIIWQCQCDCGNLCEVSSNKLQSHTKISCGCIKHSNGETIIKNLLLQAHINFKQQVSFIDCVSPKNAKLFFDFGIYDENDNLLHLIEYDGIQHFEPIEYFGGNQTFQYQQQCDEVKNKYCAIHNIKLIRIPYIKLNTLTLQDLL